MQTEQRKSENQLQSAGYVMTDTDLMTHGQQITTYLQKNLVRYYQHTDPATQGEETNHIHDPLWHLLGVGNNLTDVRHVRPRAQSLTHSRVSQSFRHIGLLR